MKGNGRNHDSRKERGNIIDRGIDFLVRKRFLIALLVFVLFVVCKLSFSSIGAWH